MNELLKTDKFHITTVIVQVKSCFTQIKTTLLKTLKITTNYESINKVSNFKVIMFEKKKKIFDRSPHVIRLEMRHKREYVTLSYTVNFHMKRQLY